MSVGGKISGYLSSLPKYLNMIDDEHVFAVGTTIWVMKAVLLHFCARGSWSLVQIFLLSLEFRVIRYSYIKLSLIVKLRLKL